MDEQKTAVNVTSMCTHADMDWVLNPYRPPPRSWTNNVCNVVLLIWAQNKLSVTRPPERRDVVWSISHSYSRFSKTWIVEPFIGTEAIDAPVRSVAPRCTVYFIESRCSLKKHGYLKVFNWGLHFKTASPAAGFILIASSDALNEASGEECG